MIEFDDAKDRAKHGISLARAADMELDLVIIDDREDYGELRYRAFGFIDGNAHCLAFMLRSGRVRAISLRRARTQGRCDVMQSKSGKPASDAENPEWSERDFA